MLILRACPIDDEALVPLAALKSLRMLDVRECEALSAGAIDALARSLPRCEVLR